MTELQFKSKLEEILTIINLSPARQSQIYFDIIVSLSEKSITLNPTVKYFDASRSKFSNGLRLREAELHVGLAMGCIETWLKDKRISYERQDIFDSDKFVVLRIK